MTNIVNGFEWFDVLDKPSISIRRRKQDECIRDQPQKKMPKMDMIVHGLTKSENNQGVIDRVGKQQCKNSDLQEEFDYVRRRLRQAHDAHYHLITHGADDHATFERGCKALIDCIEDLNKYLMELWEEDQEKSSAQETNADN